LKAKSIMKSNTVKEEAVLFAKYLGAKSPDHLLINRYYDGIKLLSLNLSSKELKVLNNILKFQFLLPFADAGFALLNPNHLIRKRLLLMGALIETDKNYIDHFITEIDIPFAVLRFIYRGSIGIFKGFVGTIMLILFRWK
jgi:hypothetical protein